MQITFPDCTTSHVITITIRTKATNNHSYLNVASHQMGERERGVAALQ